MTRATLLAVVGCLTMASALPAQTYFEDTFDGPTLKSEWTQIGTGSYVVNGDLEFMTGPGDLVDGFGGEPDHIFVVSVPNTMMQWTLLARVRFNTPDEAYEQINILAYEDEDNYVKLGYAAHWYNLAFTMKAEWDGQNVEVGNATSALTDYFWLCMVRDGDVYKTWYSLDPTTDAESIGGWMFNGRITAALENPRVGLGAWDTYASNSGELAEYDYFRVSQGVPEPVTLAPLGVGLGIAGLRRKRST